ncbi:MAG: co-chaperone GroES [Bdellovibrionales bacterium]
MAKAKKITKKAVKKVVKKTVQKKAQVKTKVKAKPKLKTKSKPAKIKKANPAAKAKAAPVLKVQSPKVNKQKVNKQKTVDVSQFVTPLDDRIVIQVLSAEKITPGGIIIPDTVSSDVGHHKAQVLAVGRGHRDSKGRLRPMDVKVGDQVFVQSHAGSKIKFNNIDLIILRETEVMGVVG